MNFLHEFAYYLVALSREANVRHYQSTTRFFAFGRPWLPLLIRTNLCLRGEWHNRHRLSKKEYIKARRHFFTSLWFDLGYVLLLLLLLLLHCAHSICPVKRIISLIQDSNLIEWNLCKFRVYVYRIIFLTFVELFCPMSWKVVISSFDEAYCPVHRVIIKEISLG